MTKCYVPVVGYVPGTPINPLFGYDLWSSNAMRTVPYIFETTLEEFGEQIQGTLLEVQGMSYGLYLHVPAKALYATPQQAIEALVSEMPTRTIAELL